MSHDCPAEDAPAPELATPSGAPGLPVLASGLAIAILVPLSAGTGRPSLRTAGAVLLISGLSVLLGRALAALFRIPRTPGFIAAFEIVAGFGAFSVLQLGATVAFGLNAAGALAVSGPAAALLFVFRDRLSFSPPAGPLPEPSGYGAFDAGVLAALSLLATLWSREALAAMDGAARSGVFHAWDDFFVHASQIVYLRDYAAFSRQSLELAGLPQIFYHRGSYAASSLYSLLSGQTGLQTALCFWLPAGMLLLGMGVYGLASALAGRLAGAAAAIMLFALPDASMYGVHNGFLSFFWLLEIAPASGYGIAIVLTALATFVVGIAASRFALVLLSAGIAAISALFKVHMAVVAAPLFFFLVLAAWNPPRRSHLAAAFAGALLGVIVLAVISEHIHFGPHFLSGTHDSLKSFSFIHAQASSGSAALYSRMTGSSGPLWANAIGTLFLLAGAFGILLPFYAFVAVLPSRPGLPWQVGAIPCALLAAYLVTIFLLPTPANGDFTEFSQRSFPLVYAVLAAASVAGLGAALSRTRGWGRWPRRTGVVVTAIALGASLVVDWTASAHIQESTLDWGRIHATTSLPVPLCEAARFIREHGRHSDRVLSSDGDPEGVVVALSERPAFLSRESVFLSIKGLEGNVAKSRRGLLDGLRTVQSYGGLAEFGEKFGVRWFLLRPGDMPAWPTAVRNRCVWSSGGFRLFDLAGPSARED